MARRRSKPPIATSEVLVWLLFFALLIPAGVTGWAIGHYSRDTDTVTVSAAGAPATTSRAATTAEAATTQQTTTSAATTEQTTTAEATTKQTTTAAAAPA